MLCMAIYAGFNLLFPDNSNLWRDLPVIQKQAFKPAKISKWGNSDNVPFENNDSMICEGEVALEAITVRN